MPVSPGVLFGPYEVIAAVGAGGMGEVYRARDRRLDRYVAIKTLPGGATPQFRDRFEREARIVARLSHPNVCALFDVGEQHGTPYLVMEYLEGETLADRLRRGPLPLDEALRYAVQMADGLAHAHALGIVHRDLKPGNVMVVGSIVKVLDFGLAKHFEADLAGRTMAAVSEVGATVGTVAYMSPEQTLGAEVDHRSDIFSLGVVLYEMVAAIRPFEGATPFSVMQKINSYDPPGPELYRPSLPPALGQLLRRMLAKTPAARPGSMAEVVEALQAMAGGSTATVAAAPRRSLRWPTTWRSWPVAAATLATAAAIVATALALAPEARSRAGAWLASLGPAPVHVAAPREGNAFDLASEGYAHLRRFDRPDNVDRAIASFQHALEVDPAQAFAHAGLAQAYLRKDSYTPDPQWVRQATESARRSVELNPDLAVAHAALGLVLVRGKDAEAGRASLERALDLDSSLLLAHVGMGEFFMESGDAAQAEAVYRHAAAIAPNEWHPLLLLGRNLYQQARYTEAASAWEQAREKSPDNALVLRNLGGVYHMLDRPEDAATALQRALEIEPTATIYSNLGTLRFFQGRYSDAARAFEKAVELNATYYLYWANLGDAYRWTTGGEEAARQAYSRAIALVDERLSGSPANPDLRTQLALYLAKHGDRERAVDELARWQASPKKTPASYFRVLLVHEIHGAREEALAALGAALEAGYPISEIRAEPELTRLRSDPRYHKLLAEFDARRAGPTR